MGIDFNEVSARSHGGTEIMAAELDKRLPTELKDAVQIIPSRLRTLDQGKIRLFWAHDLPDDPEAVAAFTNGGWQRFHQCIFVSDWQKDHYLDHYKIPWSKIRVIRNCINPIPESGIQKPLDTIELIYTSMPDRGLDILFSAFSVLLKEFPYIRLSVYSSYKVYGREEQDQNFIQLYDRMRRHPQIKLFQQWTPNEIVMQAVAKAHIFAYPSKGRAETSCISLMQAMSGRAICVHPNYGALPETSAYLTMQYGWQENSWEHCQVFYNALRNAIIAAKRLNDYVDAKSKIQDSFCENLISHLNFQKRYADMQYNWNGRIYEWINLIKALT